MQKETISDKQGISIIVLFIIGSSSISVMGLKAKKDLWLSTLLAILIALVFSFVYARIINIYPGKDIYDILEICLGKIIGKGAIAVFTVFFYYWTTDVLVNFGNFIKDTTLENTPKIVPMIVMALLSYWICKEGIESIGRYSEVILILPILSILLVIVFLIPSMDINNIRPVFYEGVKPVLMGTFDAFTFPFGQLFAFTAVFSSLKWDSSYKVYSLGLIIGGSVLFLTSVSTVLVLGASSTSDLFYPTFEIARRLNIGDFIRRAEASISILFVLGGFVKVSILLLCAGKGMAKIFALKNYRYIIMPIILLVVNLSFFLYDSVMENDKFTENAWIYILCTFEVILVPLIWIIAEIKKKKSLYIG